MHEPFACGGSGGDVQGHRKRAANLPPPTAPPATTSAAAGQTEEAAAAAAAGVVRGLRVWVHHGVGVWGLRALMQSVRGLVLLPSAMQVRVCVCVCFPTRVIHRAYLTLFLCFCLSLTLRLSLFLSVNTTDEHAPACWRADPDGGQ